MRCRSLTLRRSQAGISTVEVLLAATIFGFLAIALAGSFVYGRAATGRAGDRVRANALAEEGLEAVRNIRDASYIGLNDGTYGLVQAGNTWTLSGTSDTTGQYTRQITIVSNGANRKLVTSNVSWQQGTSSDNVAVHSQLSNWAKPKSWSTPAVIGSVDVSGGQDGIKIAAQGNYAYMVRNDGTPDFVIINTLNPSQPTTVGSLSLVGAPTNIAVSGNYAYVTSDNPSGELVIIDISVPASPVVRATYNAPGNAAGQGVTVSGNYAYIARAANGGSNEVMVLNVSNPSSPTVAGTYGKNVSMREIYIYGTNAVVITEDGQILELNINILGLLTLSVANNLAGSGPALSIAGSGPIVAISRGTSVLIYNLDTLGPPALLSNTTLPGNVYDVAYDSVNKIVYAGTDYQAGELQILNVSAPASPVINTAADVPGTSSTLFGVAYNTTQGLVVGASASDSQEAVVIGAN